MSMFQLGSPRLCFHRSQWGVPAVFQSECNLSPFLCAPGAEQEMRRRRRGTGRFKWSEKQLSMELDYCSHIHSYYLKTVSYLVQHSNLDSLTSDWSCSLIVCQGGANKPHDCGHRAQFSSQEAPQVKVKRNTPVPLGKQHKFVTAYLIWREELQHASFAVLEMSRSQLYGHKSQRPQTAASL